MDALEKDFSTSELTHQSVNARVKLETELILKQVENICALLAERNELDTAGSSEATGSRCEEASASSADNRYDRK